MSVKQRFFVLQTLVFTMLCPYTVWKHCYLYLIWFCNFQSLPATANIAQNILKYVVSFLPCPSLPFQNICIVHPPGKTSLVHGILNLGFHVKSDWSPNFWRLKKSYFLSISARKCLSWALNSSSSWVVQAGALCWTSARGREMWPANWPRSLIRLMGSWWAKIGDLNKNHWMANIKIHQNYAQCGNCLMGKYDPLGHSVSLKNHFWDDHP